MRTGIYVRVSGHEQEDNYSIPEQTERTRKYCEAKEWMVYKVYADSVYSGSTLDRPGMNALIKDVEHGNLDMVLVYKLDRLSRSQKDTMYLIEDVFEKHDVGFTSMTENFDTSTPHGKFIVGILSVFAQLERSKITERTMLGKDARAQEGKWHGGKWIPIGYDYSDDLLHINEYEAMQIVEIADLFLKGTPVRTIERMVTKKGYKHKYGEWEAKTIRRVLQSPLYIGKIKNKDKWHDGLHDPILSEKTFDEIQKLMEARRNEYGAAKPFKTLLGGMLYCKQCGARYARQNMNNLFYYACYSRSKKMKKMIKDPNCRNKNHRYEALDAAILGEIEQLIIDPNRIQNLRKNRPVTDSTEKVKAITQEIAKIDTQISKMMDLYALGTIDLDVISDKVAALNETKKNLAKEAESLNAPAKRTMTEDEIRDIASMMTDDLPLEDRRAIVQSLINFIEIDEDEITIHWKF